MLWLAELASRAVWAVSDGGVKFVAAMVSVGLGVVVIARFAKRLGRRIEDRTR